MKIALTGRHLEVGEALRRHVEDRLNDGVAKYFGHAIESHVVVAQEASEIRADIQVHVGRGILVQGHGQADDAQVAFDLALERISKRLRRYKRRLRDHRKAGSGRREDVLRAQQYILAGPSLGAEEEDDEEDEEDSRPVVIAEMTTEIERMTVGEAVMRLDLAGDAAIVFRNAAHGGLNVVYRRADGNLGWVDPAGNDRAIGSAQGD